MIKAIDQLAELVRQAEAKTRARKIESETSASCRTVSSRWSSGPGTELKEIESRAGPYADLGASRYGRATAQGLGA